MFECNEDSRLGSRCERDLYLFDCYDFYPSNHPSGGMFGLRLQERRFDFIANIIFLDRQCTYTIGVAEDALHELILFERLSCHPLMTWMQECHERYITLWFRPSEWILPTITSISVPRVVVIG